jgi:hypothetical protein
VFDVLCSFKMPTLLLLLLMMIMIMIMIMMRNVLVGYKKNHNDKKQTRSVGFHNHFPYKLSQDSLLCLSYIQSLSDRITNGTRIIIVVKLSIALYYYDSYARL